MGDGFGQSIAVKAREWGVYIAAGFHRHVADQPVGVAVLFDPDGDAVVTCCRRKGACPGEQPHPVCSVQTNLGALAIGIGSDGWSPPVPSETGMRVVAIPSLERETSEGMLAGCAAALASALHTHVCRAVGVLSAASRTDEIGSGVWDANGKLVAHCAAGEEAFVEAVIPVVEG
jgi:hypothetical protein